MKNLILALAILLNFSSVFASDFPDDSSLEFMKGILSDSGIRGPSYLEISDNLRQLAMKYPTMAEVIEYGVTPQNRSLLVLKISMKNLQTKTGQAIYIGGSIHGNEYLNIEDRLPAWFLENRENPEIKKYLSNGGVIYIAPILNPDGYDRRERENDHGVDLNRDYTVVKAGVTGFHEIETKNLTNYLIKDLEKSAKKLQVALDYHCCIGALLFPWSFAGPKIPSADQAKHELIGSIMQKNLSQEIKVGQTPVILGYSARGTSKDYYYEKFGALGFTYEGRVGKENKFFPEHTQMWVDIIAELNSK